MCRRCIRMFFLVVGSVSLFFAVFPVLAVVHFGESMETTLMASKLLLMPVGAICLVVASILHRDGVRP